MHFGRAVDPRKYVSENKIIMGQIELTSEFDDPNMPTKAKCVKIYLHENI